MHTPSGRFKINTRLCLSMSDFHPESWNPMWSLSTILMGLLSFMLEESPTYGSITSNDSTKRKFANESLAYNCKNKTFCELFPDLLQLHESLESSRPAASEGSGNSSSTSVNKSVENEFKMSWTVIIAIIAIIVSSTWAVISVSAYH